VKRLPGEGSQRGSVIDAVSIVDARHALSLDEAP